MKELTLCRPDDWHLHVRDGAGLKSVLPHSAKEFKRALIMPNLRPPVVSVDLAAEYRQRILEALPAGSDFEPLMSLYLTDKTSPEEIQKAVNSGFVRSLKLYPAGATTNSDHGVTQIELALPALEKMAELGLPLCVHGEVTDPSVDVFDREAVFIETVLQPLMQKLPELRVVMEHITTAQAAQFVAEGSANLAASVTAHHLLMNRNALFQGGIRPHHYCLPVLKRETHREALLKAVSGPQSHKFFLGTDSAPHAKNTKENACGCAGMYTAHAAMPLYAEAFESIDALDKLEAFASFNGPDFYRLPRNSGTLRLIKESWEVPSHYEFGDAEVVPLRAGEQIHWKIQD